MDIKDISLLMDTPDMMNYLIKELRFKGALLI